ncbi:hypothetical protein HDV05_008123, partial [Chytridiales sp. JEL 0842]
MPDCPATFIPLKANAGIRDWNIEGDLELRNMPMTEVQVQSVQIQNTGGLDLPFSYRLDLEDESHKSILKIVAKEMPRECNDGGAPVLIRPKQCVTLNVTATPKDHVRIRGKLTLITDLGRGNIERVFPIAFYAYAEQLALEDDSDANIGRVMMRQVVSVKRNLTNYGPVEVRYRLRIEPVAKLDASTLDLQGGGAKEKEKEAFLGAGKPKRGRAKSKLLADDVESKRFKTPWRIKESSEDGIKPSEVAVIEAVFECLDEHGEGTHEAKIVVEKCDEYNKERWTEISSFKLVGASGTPKPLLYPSTLHFPHAGLAETQSQPILLKNEGTAALEWKILTPWEFDANIYLSTDSPTQGKLDVDETTEIMFVFKPTKITLYETTIQISTQVGITPLKVSGQGAAYHFYKPNLPNILQLGLLGFGESITKQLSIWNDCMYPIKVRGMVSSNDPEKGEPLVLSGYLSLDVDVVSLEANEAEYPLLRDPDRKQGVLEVTLRVPNPLDEQGVVDPEAIKTILAAQKGSRRHFLLLEAVGAELDADSRHIIPVLFTFGTKGLVVMSSSMYEAYKNKEVPSTGLKIPEDEQMKELDFGECGLEHGGTVNVVVHNPNMFKITFETEAESVGSDFSVYPEKGTISGLGFREFSIDVKGIELEEDDQDVPPTIQKHGNWILKTNVESVPEISIPLEATLIDEVIPLNFDEPLDFGYVRTHFKVERYLIFQNPVRRSLKYSFYIQRDYADLFVLETGKDGIVAGIAPPRAE